MIKLVSAAPRLDIGGTLMDILTYPINIASLDYVPAWLFVLILAFVFGILFMSSIKVFEDNIAVAIIVPLTISLIILLTTPFASWFLWIFSWSWILAILLVLLAVIATVIRGYAVIHGWGAGGVANIKETNDDFRDRTKYFQKKEEKSTKREIKDLKEVIDQIKQAKKNEGQPDFSDQIRDIQSHLDTVGKRIIRDIKLERKRFAEAHQDAVEELKDLKRKIRADLEDGADAVGNKRLDLAERFVKRAMKKLKKFKKDSKRLAKKAGSGILKDGKQLKEDEEFHAGQDNEMTEEISQILKDYAEAWEREVDGFLAGEGGIDEGHVKAKKDQLIKGLKKEFESRNMPFDEGKIWNEYFRSKEEVFEKALSSNPEGVKLLEAGKSLDEEIKKAGRYIRKYIDQYKGQNLRPMKMKDKIASDYQNFVNTLSKQGYQKSELEGAWVNRVGPLYMDFFNQEYERFMAKLKEYGQIPKKGTREYEEWKWYYDLAQELREVIS